LQQQIYNGGRRLRGALGLCLWCGLSLLTPAVFAAQACGALQVANAWVRVVPGAPVAAGYFDLSNAGDTAMTIVALSSPQFGRVHMHESLTGDDGMATMQPVASVTVPAGQSLAFAPGGYHLMMFEPEQELAPGDKVTLQLQCEGADDRLAVTAEVRSMMPMDDGMNMQHGHHGG